MTVADVEPALFELGWSEVLLLAAGGVLTAVVIFFFAWQFTRRDDRRDGDR